MARILSGITSTGNLTIGNYLSVINVFLKLQEENELLIFVANLHGLTLPINPQELKKNIQNIIAWYFASGIKPNKSYIFIQSDILAHSQLSYIFLCNSYIGELERMTQFKDKKPKINNQKNQNISIPAGILVYPALMAADILLYDADFVPVGIDQNQHLELTKKIAKRMNKTYKTNLFKIPKIIINKQTQKIMSLQQPEKKMSKSDINIKNSIFLSDNKQEVTNKIKKAITDSENIIKFDKKNKPGVSNLLNIYSSITNKNMKNCENYFKNHNYDFLKEEVIKVINNLLEPIQIKYKEFINKKSNYLLKYLKKGTNFANNIATKKLNFIQNVIGINFIEK